MDYFSGLFVRIRARVEGMDVGDEAVLLLCLAVGGVALLIAIVQLIREAIRPLRERRRETRERFAEVDRIMEGLAKDTAETNRQMREEMSRFTQSQLARVRDGSIGNPQDKRVEGPPLPPEWIPVLKDVVALFRTEANFAGLRLLIESKTIILRFRGDIPQEEVHEARRFLSRQYPGFTLATERESIVKKPGTYLVVPSRAQEEEWPEIRPTDPDEDEDDDEDDDDPDSDWDDDEEEEPDDDDPQDDMTGTHSVTPEKGGQLPPIIHRQPWESFANSWTNPPNRTPLADLLRMRECQTFIYGRPPEGCPFMVLSAENPAADHALYALAARMETLKTCTKEEADRIREAASQYAEWREKHRPQAKPSPAPIVEASPIQEEFPLLLRVGPAAIGRGDPDPAQPCPRCGSASVRHDTIRPRDDRWRLCPHCGNSFGRILAEIPEKTSPVPAPILCPKCGKPSIADDVNPGYRSCPPCSFSFREDRD